MVGPERFERPTPSFVAKCSIQLSYGPVEHILDVLSVRHKLSVAISDNSQCDVSTTIGENSCFAFGSFGGSDTVGARQIWQMKSCSRLRSI